jgi:CheY-like chemotaxis protein
VTAAYQATQAIQPRALVVDDSQIARYVLSGQLTQLGFEVEVSSSAEAALERLTGPLPDVVFMDHLLPGIDGLEAVRRLRAEPRYSELPIVMYTSEESPRFAAMALEAGADEIFLKTAENASLRDIVQRLDLLPTESSAEHAGRNVVRFRSSEEDHTGSSLAALSQVTETIEQTIEKRNAELRQGLLAEFAILERYEERMRADLFANVDTMARRGIERIDRAFAEMRRETQGQRRRVKRNAWALAALLVLVLGAALLVVDRTVERMDQWERETGSTLAALVTEAVELSAREADRAAPAARQSAAVIDASAVMPVARPTGAPQQIPSAAQRLVEELQSMGILGPIRIETYAGSFCVRSTANGLRIQADNVPLEHCERLPIRIIGSPR